MHLGGAYFSAVSAKILDHGSGDDLVSQVELVDVSGRYIRLHPTADLLTAYKCVIMLDFCVKMARLVAARVAIMQDLTLSSV